MAALGIPLFAKLWFILTAPLLLIDATFVFTRSSSTGVPHPLADTPPFNLWVLYSTYDRRYAPNDDAFVVLQSGMNILEAALGLFAFLLAERGKAIASLKLALVVGVMTLYKTLMYFSLEAIEGGKYTKHNSTFDALMMVALPSSLWIIVPAAIILQCSCRLSVAASGRAVAPQGKKKNM
ncbi:putative Emopamil binding protein [Trypanosoma cruzi]|nr:putative Emopamil binding protein [Trypanosoma cruzi]